jgi:hypothetical protein
MKTKTLYILAAAALVGYYFYNKSKKATAATATAPALLNNLQADQNCIDCNSNPTPTPQMPTLPFSLTDAEVGPGQQVSPTPSSVLDPAQLIKFNQQVRGSLNGVC